MPFLCKTACLSERRWILYKNEHIHTDKHAVLHQRIRLWSVYMHICEHCNELLILIFTSVCNSAKTRKSQISPDKLCVVHAAVYGVVGRISNSMSSMQRHNKASLMRFSTWGFCIKQLVWTCFSMLALCLFCITAFLYVCQKNLPKSPLNCEWQSIQNEGYVWSAVWHIFFHHSNKFCTFLLGREITDSHRVTDSAQLENTH